MIVKLQTIPFTASLEEKEPRLKYPNLEGGAYLENITLNGLSYIVRISFNQFSQSPMFSLLDNDENYIIQNIMMTPKVNKVNANLLNMVGFEKYTLLWDIKNGLELYERVN